LLLVELQSQEMTELAATTGEVGFMWRLFGDGSYLVRSENERQAKAGTGREARRLGKA